eukprot:8795534-Pyramimonas_sp.AAC.1
MVYSSHAGAFLWRDLGAPLWQAVVRRLASLLEKQMWREFRAIPSSVARAPALPRTSFCSNGPNANLM